MLWHLIYRVLYLQKEELACRLNEAEVCNSRREINKMHFPKPRKMLVLQIYAHVHVNKFQLD